MRITSGRLKMDMGEWGTHSNNIPDFTIECSIAEQNPKRSQDQDFQLKKLAPRFSVHTCIAGGT